MDGWNMDLDAARAGGPARRANVPSVALSLQGFVF